MDDEDKSSLLGDIVYCDIFADANDVTMLFCIGNDSRNDLMWAVDLARALNSELSFAFFGIILLIHNSMPLASDRFCAGASHLQENRQKQTRPELTDTFLILHNRRHDDDTNGFANTPLMWRSCGRSSAVLRQRDKLIGKMLDWGFSLLGQRIRLQWVAAFPGGLCIMNR